MKKIITTQCKMNGHLTELPCTASDCTLVGDCYAEYEKAQKPMTNADRIRAMSDEELADFIIEAEACGNEGVSIADCGMTMLEWIKQPAEVK